MMVTSRQCSRLRAAFLGLVVGCVLTAAALSYMVVRQHADPLVARTKHSSWDPGQSRMQYHRREGITNGYSTQAVTRDSAEYTQGNAKTPNYSDMEQAKARKSLGHPETSNVISKKNDASSIEINFERDWLNVLHVHQCTTFMRNVYYVKVHKTGSSTMVTVLYGFVRRHNLALYPLTNDIKYRDSADNIISFRFAPPKESPLITFNVFGEHAWFNASAATLAMPSDTVYMASLRYPYSQMRSYFNEFRLQDRFGFNSSDPVEEFLLSPHNYDLDYLKNYQSAYLGYMDGESFENFLERTENRFSIVLIAEYFDESLVLLRRLLCWDIVDIMNMELRHRNYESKYRIPTATAVGRHRVFSNIDYKLYDYFVMKLLISINAQPHFWDELYVFRNVKEKVLNYCSHITKRLQEDAFHIYDIVRKERPVMFDPSPWGRPFRVGAVGCAMMALRTLVHRNILKVRQFPELCRYPIAQELELGGTIVWYEEGVSLQMNRTFCQALNNDAVSMAVLASKEAYMWNIVGRKKTATKTKIERILKYLKNSGLRIG